MKDIEWIIEEMAIQWFGLADDLAREPLQIERAAKARVEQFKLTVFEFDRSMSCEPARV